MYVDPPRAAEKTQDNETYTQVEVVNVNMRKYLRAGLRVRRDARYYVHLFTPGVVAFEEG